MNKAVSCPICGNPQELYSTATGILPGVGVPPGANSKRYACSKCGLTFHIEINAQVRAFTMR